MINTATTTATVSATWSFHSWTCYCYI